MEWVGRWRTPWGDKDVVVDRGTAVKRSYRCDPARCWNVLCPTVGLYNRHERSFRTFADG